jgi:hypothetical protein
VVSATNPLLPYSRFSVFYAGTANINKSNNNKWTEPRNIKPTGLSMSTERIETLTKPSQNCKPHVMLQALCYRPEGRGFESRRDH